MQTLRSDDGAVLAEAERALRRSHQRVTRVSVLDELFNPLSGYVFTGADGYAVSGSVNMDLSRSIRRTVSLQLANPDGIWTPAGEDSAFYWNKHIKVERGVVAGGVEYLAPLGVFLIDSPSVDRRHNLVITGSDRMDRATRSEFTSPTMYSSGAGVGATIREILEDSGVGATLWTVDDGGATLGADRHYEIGDSRLQAALSLATSFALEVYADANGYMVIRPARDPDEVPSSWTFREGPDATHLGVSKRWSRDRFYNHVLVTGENADQEPVRGEAEVTDPSNPLRTDGPMGDRLYKYTSGMITTQAQAIEVAYALLWEKALIEEEIALEHVANPLLEAGDAVTIIDDVTRTDDKYMVQSLTIPLAGGPARLDVSKIRRISG